MLGTSDLAIAVNVYAATDYQAKCWMNYPGTDQVWDEEIEAHTSARVSADLALQLRCLGFDAKVLMLTFRTDQNEVTDDLEEHAITTVSLEGEMWAVDLTVRRFHSVHDLDGNNLFEAHRIVAPQIFRVEVDENLVLNHPLLGTVYRVANDEEILDRRRNETKTKRLSWPVIADDLLVGVGKHAMAFPLKPVEPVVGGELVSVTSTHALIRRYDQENPWEFPFALYEFVITVSALEE